MIRDNAVLVVVGLILVVEILLVIRQAWRER